MPPEEKQTGAEKLDPTKLGERLAQREFEAMQKAGQKTAEVDPDAARLSEYAQKKAAIEANLEREKAKLVAPAPEKKVDQADQKATETTTLPSAKPQSTPTETKTTEETAKVPEPPKAAGTMDKIKEFFSKISAGFAAFFKQFTDKIGEMTGKLFGKKTETKTVSTAPEKANSSNESWKEIIDTEAKRIGIEPAFAYAVITTEVGPNKKGLNEDGTPVIRFEPHVFNSQLASKGINEKHGKWGASTLSGRNVDGVSCEGGQPNEHACLRKAMEINKDAALRSVSMGMGQLMGFNHGLAGYGSAEEMFNKFSKNGGGEAEQIRAMFKLIENTKPILNAARNKDFGAFTRAYNGSKPGSDLYNRYVSSMQNAYAKNGGGSAGKANA